jgi:hypothetical protein
LRLGRGRGRRPCFRGGYRGPKEIIAPSIVAGVLFFFVVAVFLFVPTVKLLLPSLPFRLAWDSHLRLLLGFLLGD